MTRRIRTALLLTASAALALPASGAAIATPTVPALTGGPAFSTGTSITPSWSAATFTGLSKSRKYEVQVTDLTVASAQIIEVPATELSATIGGRVNGHRYSMKVRGTETRCTVSLPGDPPVCLVYAPAAVSGAWSDPVFTRMDATAPSGSVAVNGGAAFTNSRDVTLNLTASDPPSNGQASSGVGGVQISHDAVFDCVAFGSTDECPLAFAPFRATTLPEGPDGPRTVRVRFMDDARPFAGGLIFDPTPGNVSGTASDVITLDRSLPTPVVSQGVTTAAAGTPVAFSAVASTDATSGVDTASATWDFGDGTPPVTGLQVEKSFANPGTLTGTLTIRDRAGNANSQQFTMTVTGVPVPGAGGATVTDPGTPPPATTSDTDVILGAKRLNRAVQGRKLRIRVRLAEAARVRVTILRISPTGKAVVRRQTKQAGPGFTVFTFAIAPKAGRHQVRVRAGADALDFTMGIARR